VTGPICDIGQNVIEYSFETGSGRGPIYCPIVFLITFIEKAFISNFVIILYIKGTAVAQWLRCCVTIRKFAGSIPAAVIRFFIDIIIPIALRPWGRLYL